MKYIKISQEILMSSGRATQSGRGQAVCKMEAENNSANVAENNPDLLSAVSQSPHSNSGGNLPPLVHSHPSSCNLHFCLQGGC